MLWEAALGFRKSCYRQQGMNCIPKGKQYGAEGGSGP